MPTARPSERADRAARPKCDRRRTADLRRHITHPVLLTLSLTRPSARTPEAGSRAGTASPLRPRRASARGRSRTPSHRSQIAQLVGRRRAVFDPTTRMPRGSPDVPHGYEDRGRGMKILGDAANDPAQVRRKQWAAVMEQRFGHLADRPGIRRQVVEPERRGRSKGFACPAELKEDGPGPLNGGDCMLVKHREQLARAGRSPAALEGVQPRVARRKFRR